MKAVLAFVAIALFFSCANATFESIVNGGFYSNTHPWTTAQPLGTSGTVYYDPTTAPTTYVMFLNAAVSKQGIIRQAFNYSCNIADPNLALDAELTFKFQAATTLSDSLGAQSTLSVNLRYADGSLLQNLVQLSNLNHVNTWVSYGPYSVYGFGDGVNCNFQLEFLASSNSRGSTTFYMTDASISVYTCADFGC